MRVVLILIFITTSLFSALQDKSAIVYYGEDISYPMVGIHDYIIVQPSHINTELHGFKVYKDQMYAYVSVGEISKSTPQYTQIKQEWVIAKNTLWQSEVLDLKNPEYIEFIFTQMIEPQIQRGFKNFFFDTLDSYQLASKNMQERKINEKALVAFIREFHKRYKDSKLIVNRAFEVIDEIHSSLEAVLFESYYHGISGEKLSYQKVSAKDREWLNIHINKIKAYSLPIISVEYLNLEKMDGAKELTSKILKQGMIPYIANRELDTYGYSSKNAIKREIFTLINEKRLDRTLQEAHQYGGTVLEYMGYIEKLHDINSGLPKIKDMQQYAGVIIWLQDFVQNPYELMAWIQKLKKANIKVAFANNFGFNPDNSLLQSLGIEIQNIEKIKNKIKYQNEIMGYEIDPPFSVSTVEIQTKSKEPLLTYEYKDGSTSTPAAITSWGGYAVEEAFMVNINEENIWVVDPFEFFRKSLNLKELLVPDVTTENGKRLLFTHIDGDGIMNLVEGNFGHYSGDVILNKILKVYKIPHSVSVIGSEIYKEGLYPKISPELIKIVRDIYKQENVEPATHTFTHPFFWEKIINNNLDQAYRLKPKNYQFSLDKEIKGELQRLNKNFSPKHKAKVVFWSGDCAPRVNALSHIYKEDILNINGGDTTISTTAPWLSLIAPLGLQRDDYTQVYTGAQNENVFTNDWLGPFWGFKRVVQTFKLTDSPRRFKPIDIYYHIYSGSKKASLKALEYVFDWAIKQDSMPIFTSEYIPKVMDFYTVSMANKKSSWLVSGMKSLKTLRVEKENTGVDLKNSSSVLGVKHFEKHTYVSLEPKKKHILELSKEQDKSSAYLISANGEVTSFKRTSSGKDFIFNAHVPLKLEFHLPSRCTITCFPKADKKTFNQKNLSLIFAHTKAAKVSVSCSH
jgi:hypothetical protein